MTKDEIQTAILNICKVPMHSGDFNIVAFDSLCNKLIELGAEKEREDCIKIVMQGTGEPVQRKTLDIIHQERTRIALAIKGQE